MAFEEDRLWMSRSTIICVFCICLIVKIIMWNYVKLTPKVLKYHLLQLKDEMSLYLIFFTKQLEWWLVHSEPDLWFNVPNILTNHDTINDLHRIFNSLIFHFEKILSKNLSLNVFHRLILIIIKSKELKESYY